MTRHDVLMPMLIDPVAFTRLLLQERCRDIKTPLEAILAACCGVDDKRDPNLFLQELKLELGAAGGGDKKDGDE